VATWDKVTVQAADRERIYAKNRTFFGDVVFRFTRKFTAVFGLVLIVLLLLFAFVGPFISPYSYTTQSLEFANIPPRLELIPAEGSYFYITTSLKVIEVTPEGTLLRSLQKTGEDGINRTMSFAVDDETDLVLAYREKPPAFLVDGKPLEAERRTVWNQSFRLGSDALGRDLLTRLMYGSRISLIVAFVATLVNMTIGILYGGISGYIGGTADQVMMRIVDIISTIPLTLYVILIMVVLKSGFLSIIIALSSVYWVNMARVVRGQIYTLKHNEFVLAARTIGSSNGTILFRHLLPNAMGPILVTATMMIPSAIFLEAFLGYIGLGVAPPMSSLGTMSNDAIGALRMTPYQLFAPSLVICLIMFAFNFVGDGLRDALDPKLKK